MAVLPVSSQDEKRRSLPQEDGVAIGREELDTVVDEAYDDLHREMKPRQLSWLTL